MILFAVAAQSTQPTQSAPAHDGSAVSAANYAGGATILLLLALMLTAGFSAAGLLPRRKQNRKASSDQHLA